MSERSPKKRSALLDVDLHGAFSADALGRPAPLSALDPHLPDHLFAEPPPASELSGSPGTAPVNTASTASTASAAGSEMTMHWRSGSSPSIASLPDLPPIGSIIDKYRLEALLGVGGFGAVYRATHLLLQRTVAIKLLRSKTLRSRPDLANLLFEEARFAARIAHPNVVQVFDVTHNPEITYVVMEHVEGTTLARMIARQGALPTERVSAIGVDVAQGLAAALAQGVLHRDIKPQNIMITRSGAAKVLDLGLARSTAVRVPGRESAGGRSLVVGTVGYMAPEQAQHPERADFRADIYSLGVTLYHTATGAPPFPMSDPAACAEMHRSAPVPPPASIMASIDGRLSSLLLWMLEKAPERRPASYEILEGALRRIGTSAAGE